MGNFFFLEKKKNKKKIKMPLIIEVQQQQLQIILQMLTELEQIGDSILYDPNICQTHQTMFIIWYENKLEKIRQQLDEITAELCFFYLGFCRK